MAPIETKPATAIAFKQARNPVLKKWANKDKGQKASPPYSLPAARYSMPPVRFGAENWIQRSFAAKVSIAKEERLKIQQKR